MTNLGLDYAARAFKNQAVDGADLAECLEADFISLIVSKTGAIADTTLVPMDSYFSQLVPTWFFVVNLSVLVPRRRARA